ncbi:MAG: hypothetical protein AAFR38_07425 [Planctomycetota bacterium]
MNAIAASAALAAAAVPALAQVSITIETKDFVQPGEIFDVTVFAESSVDNVGATGFRVQLVGSGAIVPGSIQDALRPESPPGGFTVFGASASTFIAENFVALFGNFGTNQGIGANGPQALFTFQVRANDVGEIEIQTLLEPTSLATGANDGEFLASDIDVNFSSFTIGVPTPGASAALAIGGLALTRRRR